ncbi:MAG: ATP-dependent sacrificial sulfur transferase LarE [Candidatus Hydrogenedentes bacterium]|nr:ATP-dependent sacrificial sulfur transferase LarE [Candidatus Hydrogenedentota bacterium]
MATPTVILEESALEKEARLKDLLRNYGAIAIAYSGGVDSTYLSDVAHETLGAKARVLLGDSPSIPRSEVAEATALAKERGWNFEVLFTEEFANDDYLKNDGTRCYHCRAELFTKMRAYAESTKIPKLAYGEITDDLVDTTRLGAKAAKEFEVVAPLVEANMTKAEIRVLSERRGLPTADKPSFACLSSRFPVGTRVTIEDLQKVEKAEEALKKLGFRQYRARHHGDLCRIEVDPDDLPRLLDGELRDAVVASVRGAGYRFVTIDLSGYRTGSTA